MKKLLLVIVLLMAVFSAGVLYAMYLRTNLIISKKEAKERYSKPYSHFLQWRGAEVHYTDEGQGTPVLMVHGFGGNFTNYDSLAAILKANYRVIRLDLPGFGLSDLPQERDSVAALYHDFLDFMLDTLKIDSLYAVGNSLGGWVSWELAADKPQKVKKLVLLGSAGYEIEKVKSNIGRIDLLNNSFMKKLIERGLPLWASMQNARRMISPWEEPNPDQVIVNNALMNRDGNLMNLIALGNSGVMPDTSKITKVSCPTLVIWGKYDEIVPWEHAEKFKRDIAKSIVVVYDTCGHIPQIEYPHRVANDMERFFNSY